MWKCHKLLPCYCGVKNLQFTLFAYKNLKDLKDQATKLSILIKLYFLGYYFFFSALTF